jgi:pyruvate dehydrogenase E1 component alpha subunit
MLYERFDVTKGQMLTILDKDGKVNKELEPEMPDELLLKGYRTMLLTRMADDKALKLQRQGRLGAFPPCKGQEAASIGPALAMDKEDWFVWSFREMGGLLCRGVPLSTIFLYWMGNEEGSRYPPEVRATPSCVPVGSQIPHAVGLAYAERMRGGKGCALAFFGDGGTSEGDFHEGLNYAGVLRTPNVFVCQNNQWAISLPRAEQTASATLAQKALAYGFPGLLVDGNDLLAMYAAAKEGLERARSGKGPMLIEAYTYRLGDHTTSDDATRYRLESELKEWEKKDPLPRMRAYMTARGLWSEKKEKEAVQEFSELIEADVKKAEEHPAPTLDEVYAYNYAELPPALAKQRDSLREGRW